ncbi:hypothetical protein DESC_870117 [Desulfosarcina cetonica]|nr:hypothetical protein DESC_870117 [Desulfosarcina cetonica]
MHLILNRAAVDGTELMSGGFFLGGGSENLDQLLIGATASENFPEGFVVIRKKAGPQFSVGRQTQTIALAAEVMAQGADEADFTWRAGNAKSPGGAVVATVFNGNQFPQRRADAFLDFGRQDLILRTRAAVADGHVFDEADVEGIRQREPAEIDDFVVVDAPHGHGVDLDRGKTDCMGALDSRPHAIKHVIAGNVGIAFAFQRIQADVDAADTGIENPLGIGFEQHAVGGQGDIFQFRNGRQAAQKIDGAVTDQGFSAGDANLLDPQANADVDDAQNFLVAENLVVGQTGDAAIRYAVKASQVTTVGNGNPQIVEVALFAVDQAVVYGLMGSVGHCQGAFVRCRRRSLGGGLRPGRLRWPRRDRQW